MHVTAMREESCQDESMCPEAAEMFFFCVVATSRMILLRLHAAAGEKANRTKSGV